MFLCHETTESYTFSLLAMKIITVSVKQSINFKYYFVYLQIQPRDEETTSVKRHKDLCTR